MSDFTNDFYDAVIIGGGPAGLSSAIYMARAKYKTIVLEKERFGGQITITEEVVNYPGVYYTSGENLTKEMQRQAESFGAEFLIANVQDFKKEGEMYVLNTSKGQIKTLGIIIASGASPRKVGFSGEIDFQGKGVAYCATCDGEFFTGKEIFVIGSGFAACEEALFLTRFATKLHLVMRGKDFSCTASVVNEVKEHDNISIYYNTTVSEVYGSNVVQGIKLQQNGEDIDFFKEEGIGVFVFAGYVPASDNFANLVTLNEQKYIITDANQKTNLDGVYAAGDICVKNLRQVVTAVSDGATAATSLEKYIAGLYEALNLPKRAYTAPQRAEKMDKSAEKTSSSEQDEEGFISEEIRAELQPILERFESEVLLKYKVDNRDISKEVAGFMSEFKTLSNKIGCVEDSSLPATSLPSIALCNSDGTYKGVSFHGVPGGHEFNSFVIGLYNAAGPGQKIAEEDMSRIKALKNHIKMQIAVTLSCTNCPELVMSAQRIALENENITLDIFDLSQFEELKNKHNIMSVPCLILNEEHIHFGKKNLEQILDILEAV